VRRFINKASKVTVGLLSGAAVAFALAYVSLTVLGYKPVAVYSGSMEPTIPVGGLALDRAIPSKNVRVGDVITFSDPYVKGRLVTHRVIDILYYAHTREIRSLLICLAALSLLVGILRLIWRKEEAAPAGA